MPNIRPLIIGEAPSRTGNPAEPITGACGEKLAAFCGLSKEAFTRTFHRANLLGAWPGCSGKGSAWDAKASREAARRTKRRFIGGRIVVLLGHRVAEAFGCDGGYFEFALVERARVVVVPHPSGVNRWYNDPDNVNQMRRFMAAICRSSK